MSTRRKVLSLVLAMAVGGAAFVYAQVDIAVRSIRFDLRSIGASVYEAHSRSGRWPARIADLEGTEYLRMPHRKTMLDEGLFVVVWQQDLAPSPAANRDRILAYDNSSLLSRFGRVYVCRGDLRIERVGRNELPAPNVRR